jgi:hypothetical protein
MLLVVLLIVGVCGGAVWFGYNWLVSQAGSSNGTSTNNSAAPTQTKNGTPVATIVNTLDLKKQSVTFASIQMTFTKAQTANFFDDDTSYEQTPGTLRVFFNEENKGPDNSYLAYNSILKLAKPDKTVIPAAKIFKNGSPAAGTTQENWVDFRIDKSVDIKTLTLQIGDTSKDASFEMPLTGSADLSKYQDKTSSPNKVVPYGNTTWTITNARTSYSYKNEQADKGMIFVTINAKIDNQSDKTHYVQSGNLRLKAGDTTAAPKKYTFPGTVPEGTNASGEVTFQVPQGFTKFTFILPKEVYFYNAPEAIPVEIEIS